MIDVVLEDRVTELAIELPARGPVAATDVSDGMPTPPGEVRARPTL